MSVSNMSLLERTKLLLRRYRISPNKVLGQNFMIEPSIFESMSDYASLNQDDVALDIGAGLGFLTRFLAEKCKGVLAVEADDRLVQVLREQLRDLLSVTVLEGNVLKIQIPEFSKVVSIPPYQISSRLLLWSFKRDFDASVLILQKEFVNHLTALVGSEDYGWLAVLTYYHAECERLENVSKWMFYPQPEVDSIIVRLKPKKPPPFTVNNEELFTRLVRSIFTQRNRKVRNAVHQFLRNVLAKTAEDAEKATRSLPFRDERVRQLAPEDFGELLNALSS
ncbi:MAG: 16S rRNA (adenine(1518)-N(6)/adenine(1519)-N(6))-dimethyltransferase RsmA [Candidatus Bathyarchaeia archaeon]